MNDLNIGVLPQWSVGDCAGAAEAAMNRAVIAVLPGSRPGDQDFFLIVATPITIPVLHTIHTARQL
jgi:hypothetical protein